MAWKIVSGSWRGKMENVLVVASVASMIYQFIVPDIKLFQELGYHVDVACNYLEGSSCSKECVAELEKNLKVLGVGCFQVDFARNVARIDRNMKAYHQLDLLAKKKKYDFVHCHTPIGGALGRIVFQKYRKTGTKVVYTAHGFHFFKGSPLRNWILYYPVEKFLSRWTDCLITINKEDYGRAKKRFHAKRTEYVPGVGIDLEKFSVPDLILDKDNVQIPYLVWKEKKRKELGIGVDDFVIVSVGELNANKNHRIVIEAIAQMKNKKVKYLVCGQGNLKNELTKLIKKHRLEQQVFLLGFCNDVRNVLWIGNLFAFPSKREGLPVALMEAMACGIPCLVSDIRGNRDLFGKEDVKYLLPTNQPQKWANSIEYCIAHSKDEMETAKKKQKKMLAFSKDRVIRKIRRIYI